MLSVVFGFLLIAVVFLVVALIKKKSGKGPVNFPYQLKEVLCSPSERSFLGALDQIVGKQYRIFTKVRLADIIDVEKGVSASTRQRAFNRITGKHVDFIVCNADDLSIIGAIELDDKTHRGRGRQERDQFLEKTLEVAGVPLLRIKARSTYSIKEISTSLDLSFNISVGTGLEDRQISMDALQVSDEKPDGEATDKSNAESIVPVCPKCGAELMERVATKGQFAGQKFWGCPNFPKCKFTRKLEQEPVPKPEAKHDH